MPKKKAERRERCLICGKNFRKGERYVFAARNKGIAHEGCVYDFMSRQPSKPKRQPKKKNPSFAYGDRVHVSASDQRGKKLKGIFVVLGHAARGVKPGLIVQSQRGQIYIVSPSSARRANGEEVDIERAKDRFTGFHWGNEPEKVEKVKVASPEGKVLTELGEATAVVYKTKKGKEPNVEYEHKFSKPRPSLAMDEDENLYYVGGRYRVEDRGIVD